MPSEDLFGELRSLLQSGAGTARGWGRLCELVERFEPERFSAQVLPYVLAHRDKFPEHLRFVPRRWLEEQRLWPLARLADALLIDSASAQAASAYLSAQDAAHFKLLIIHARLVNKEDAPVMSHVVGQELPTYTSLRGVRSLFILSGDWLDHQALYTLLSSEPLNGLEWLVARGLGKVPWLKDALKHKLKLRKVDLSVGELSCLDELPPQVEALCMEHMEGSLESLVGWLKRASADLSALNLNTTTLEPHLVEALARPPTLGALKALTITGDRWAQLLAHPALLPKLSQTLAALTIIDPDSDSRADFELAPPRWNMAAWAVLAELGALRSLTLKYRLTLEQLVSLLEANPSLEHLELIVDWTPALVTALEARALSARLMSLKINSSASKTAAGVCAMNPAAWPALCELYVEKLTQRSSIKLADAPIIERLNLLGLGEFTIESGSFEALHERCGQTLSGLILPDCELSAAQVHALFSRAWPALKLLKLNRALATDKLWSSLVAAKGLPQLRWLQLNSVSGGVTLADVLEADLDALEYVQEAGLGSTTPHRALSAQRRALRVAAGQSHDVLVL